MATIFEKQTITFAPDEAFFGLCVGDLGTGELIEGEIYDVYFDGTKYTCTAEPMELGDLSGVGLGNKAIPGIGDDTGEPFIIGNVGNMILCFSTDTKEASHEIGIYEHEEAEEPNGAILEEQTITFYPDEGFGGLCFGDVGAAVELIEGESYDVVFDGVTYTCIAEHLMLDGFERIGLGNKSIVGIGEDSGEPFIIGVVGYYTMALTFEFEETTHTIGIYTHTEEEPEEPQGIILRNYHGENVVHEGIETISFGNTDGGITTFTRGIALENVPISVDFSNGDQTVTAEEETLIKSAVIEKPENLIPENIRIGQNIAGVHGAFIGEAEETEVDLNMVNGDMVITPSENKLFSAVTVKKPETLTQENIAAGVEIAGIVGTHQGGGGGGSLDDENLKYFMLSFENYGIVTHKPFYNKIYAETGSYDIEVPDMLGGLPVYIESNGTGNGFFNYSNVKNITIGENVKWLNNSMNRAFLNCTSFNSPVNIPDGVTNMLLTFQYCYNFNHPVTIPNSVTSMYSTFYSCYNFNQPITIPNSVTSLEQCFASCVRFNQPFVVPDSVTTIAYLFNYSYGMNSPIVIGNSVINGHRMIAYAYNFNAPVTLGSNIQDFYYAFANSNKFNQPLTIPNTAINFMNTFQNCTNLNQPITIYPDANISTMNASFFNCQYFNQPINIPRNVTGLVNTFRNCKNMSANITVYAKNINNVHGFLNYKNNSKRVNIFVPPNCNTNTAFFSTSYTSSVVNATISWTNDTANNCRYNTRYNIYIYHTVTDEETGA